MVKGKTFEVEVVGLAALQARLQPGRLLQPTSQFIEDLGKAGQRTAQRAAKPHPADKGTLGRAIHLEISSDRKTARIAPDRSISGIAFTIEEGRKPGRRPPYKAIKQWAIAHGIVPAGKGNSAQVKALRETIKDRGTQGVHYMAQAQEATDKALHHGIPRTEKEIKAIWDRP